MKTGHFLTLQALVFALVTAAFTNIYITQPVLPVLSAEFGINESTASFSVSAVILGIALANLPFGRLADRYSNKAGNGATMALGSLIFGVFLGCTLVKSFPAIVAGLVGICGGFFMVHSAAAGSLNRKLSTSRGRANSLYVLFYYIGGYAGITLSGYCYIYSGWPIIVILGLIMLLLPFITGIFENQKEKAVR